MEQSHKIYYHDDLDGRAAAYVVKRWISDQERGALSFQFTPSEYGKPFPMKDIDDQDTVWILDFSIEPDEMKELLDRAKKVIWIDHHKTAIAKYKDFPDVDRIDGIRDDHPDAPSGCALAWEFFTGERPPTAIKLISDRDTWHWNFGLETKQFHAAAQSHDTHPGSFFWEQVTGRADGPGGPERAYKEFWDRLMKDGAAIERYRTHFYRDYRDALEFSMKFEGHDCLALNVARMGSEAFGPEDKAYESADILVAFSYNGDFFGVSMYSKLVDVSEIAKKYGGGGHEGAAGFQLTPEDFLGIFCKRGE